MMAFLKRITSDANPKYRALLKLARSSRERRNQRLTLIDGVHLLDAYLGAGGRPRDVLVAEEALSRAEVAALIARIAAQPLVVSASLFQSLTELRTPSGILAAIEIPAPSPPAPPGCWLLLEDIQDPGNLGSILRSAAAAGVRDAWLSKGCADTWSPKVLRAAMGAHFSLNIHDHADVVNVALRCPGGVVALDANAPRSIFVTDLTGPVAFALGNEGSGLSRALLEAATERTAVPMQGATESLNVAAVAAVCLFERVRQLSAEKAPPNPVHAFDVAQVLIPKSE
jgi:TrmH family RNA methyltransferase